MHVIVPGQAAPVVVVDEVAVPSGDSSADPRLARLDLTGRIRRLEVELRGPGGKAVPRGVIGYSVGPGARRHVGFEDGRAILLAPTEFVQAEVIAPGHERGEELELRDGSKVELGAGLPVRLRLHEAVELPPTSLELRVQLLPRIDGPRGGTPESLRTGRSARSLVWPWRVRRTGDRGRGSRAHPARQCSGTVVRVLEPPRPFIDSRFGSDPGLSSTLEVPAGGLVETVVVAPDPKAYAEQVERLSD